MNILLAITCCCNLLAVKVLFFRKTLYQLLYLSGGTSEIVASVVTAFFLQIASKIIRTKNVICFKNKTNNNQNQLQNASF